MDSKYSFKFNGYTVEKDGKPFVDVHGATFTGLDYAQMQALQHMVKDAADELVQLGDAAIPKVAAVR
ncbi:MAG: hypothetical protein ACYDHZ_08105 [Dehalococcoidia bacterium]